MSNPWFCEMSNRSCPEASCVTSKIVDEPYGPTWKALAVFVPRSQTLPPEVSRFWMQEGWSVAVHVVPVSTIARVTSCVPPQLLTMKTSVAPAAAVHE